MNKQWQMILPAILLLAVQSVTYGETDALQPQQANTSIKLITSFEEAKLPFAGGEVVAKNATEGGKALLIKKNAIMDSPQNWQGYDYLKADFYSDATEPVNLSVDICDSQTKGYWTRYNATTIIPPGKSTYILPLKQLYVGEKSRPGRNVILNEIKRLAFGVDNPSSPVIMDNVRLERDDSAKNVFFDGLYAFELGPSTGPAMDGFTRVTPKTLYSKSSGFGLLDATIWHGERTNVLQPDPLYQKFLCIEKGGLAVDLPNGKYHVFVNIDNPSGFWGEFQTYKKRTIKAQGKEVVSETMNLDLFKQRYFCFWNTEDLPTDNTFDKYQKAYYSEKQFDVDVQDGQLKLEFEGENYACSVSCVIIYPVDKVAQGEKFLNWVVEKRRFYFDNYFKRILHQPTGEPLKPTVEESKLGYITFTRDYMQDIYYNDTPKHGETGKALTGNAFAGEYEPLALGIVPLKELGKVTVTVSNLSCSSSTIPASAIDVGFVSYRLFRVTYDGAVYTIKPRLIMPSGEVGMPKEVTRCFWLTVKTPVDAKPGIYAGKVTINPEKGESSSVPVKFTVRNGILDPLDIPAGPWGYSIQLPFKDPEAAKWENDVAVKSLKKMREYGFTFFSGMPTVYYRGHSDGKPVLDFSVADAQMKMARELGFTMGVSSYGTGITNLNLYYKDEPKMKAAGFTDYSEFIKSIFTAVQKHSDENNWLPVYWNLCDEPLDGDLKRSAENAEVYRKAFTKGPPYFTGASSFTGKNKDNPHFILSSFFHVANWNSHDEDSVNLIHSVGGNWAFYNSECRWTYGDYLYKAAKEFDLKFRIAWHWNNAAGNPYYALDCREDDYAWCNATPEGNLVPSLEFVRISEGIKDYRRLLTLARLVRENNENFPATEAGGKLIKDRMAAFKLGQREHEKLFGDDDWNIFRNKIGDAIEALRK